MAHPAHLILFFNGVDATQGEIWECGVFQGNTAFQVKNYAGPHRVMRLFDTFCGMPVSGPHDTVAIGEMNDTSLERVKELMAGQENVFFYPGVMPATFAGLEDRTISVVNIDVDQYESVKACLEFLYPRVHKGGHIILDDYNCKDCPGAKLATDEFMADKPEQIIRSAHPCSSQVYFVKA